MKITIKREDLPKRRNPEFLAARKRKAGVHEKPYKVERRDKKASLRKEWAQKIGPVTEAADGGAF